MTGLIGAAFARGRTVLLVFLVVLIGGTVSYISIPKESEPDIQIPIIYVSMTHEGISPEDAERLLVRPMEKELRSIEGVKEMRSVGAEGYGSVTLEFRRRIRCRQGAGRRSRKGRYREVETAHRHRRAAGQRGQSWRSSR